MSSGKAGWCRIALHLSASEQIHKQLHNGNNYTWLSEFGTAYSWRQQTFKAHEGEQHSPSCSWHLLQSQSPSPGDGWKHVPGPRLGSQLGSGSAAPGQGDWCAQRSHCCHCGQIASSLQLSEGYNTWGPLESEGKGHRVTSFLTQNRDPKLIHRAWEGNIAISILPKERKKKLR